MTAFRKAYVTLRNQHRLVTYNADAQLRCKAGRRLLARRGTALSGFCMPFLGSFTSTACDSAAVSRIADPGGAAIRLGRVVLAGRGARAHLVAHERAHRD